MPCVSFQLIIEWTIFPPGSINLNKKYHLCLSQPNVPILSAPSSHVQGKTSWGILLPQAGIGGTKWATTGHICLGKSWPLHAMTHSLPYMGLPSGTSGKEPACQWRRLKRHRFDPWMGGDPLEEGMATHSSILAWRIPWTEEPGRLQSMGLQRVRRDWSDLAGTYTFDLIFIFKKYRFLYFLKHACKYH